jgi:hypothetical protein
MWTSRASPCAREPAITRAGNSPAPNTPLWGGGRYNAVVRKSLLLIAALAALWTGCGPDGKTAAAPPVETAKPKPADESRRFPKTDLVETKVIDSELMGKKFMPGGTLAHYKKGPVEYDLFLAKTASPSAAAMLLPDWSSSLTAAKLVPSFGGYFGQDGGRPIFVFAKGSWIAGIAGLPQAEADVQARTFASRIE